MQIPVLWKFYIAVILYILQFAIRYIVPAFYKRGNYPLPWHYTLVTYLIVPVPFIALFTLFHKDPFDRILIWKCINDNITLISQDKKFSQYKEYGLKFI